LKSKRLERNRIPEIICIIQRLGVLNAAFHMNQNSKEWLKTHGIEYLKLSLKDLVQQGAITKFVLFPSCHY
jgi:hypothetical protein